MPLRECKDSLSDTLHLMYLQKLQLANAETVRRHYIPLSVAFQFVPANPSFSLRPDIKNDLHSGWSG